MVSDCQVVGLRGRSAAAVSTNSLLARYVTGRALTADLCGSENTMFYRTMHYDCQNFTYPCRAAWGSWQMVNDRVADRAAKDVLWGNLQVSTYCHFGHKYPSTNDNDPHCGSRTQCQTQGSFHTNASKAA